MLFKRTRRGSLTAIFACVGVFIVATLLLSISQDSEARMHGFKSHADRRAATEAGVKDAAEWASVRDKTAAELAEKKKAELAAEMAERSRLHEEERRRKEEADAKCREDLSCWAEKHYANATIACRPVVENVAKNDARWTDGTFEPKFSRYRWKARSEGVVTYIGDKIEFQNGFGAWMRHVYECDYSTSRGSVVDIRARQGRLPS